MVDEAVVRPRKPPCPDRPAALAVPGAGRPVGWPIRLFSMVQARATAKMVGMDETQIATMQRPAPDNAIMRAIFGKLAPGVTTRDETFDAGGHSLTLRLFELPGRPRPGRAILYMHGGGWVLGDIGLTNWICSELAVRTGMVVASLGYRLSPAVRFPGALSDCYEALKFLHARAGAWGLDPAHIGVAGESAGGNLAAALCLLAREKHGPAIDFQTLIYPALDLGWTSPSYQQNESAPILTPDAMRFFRDCYLGPGGDGLNPLASPLLAAALEGLPPALIQVAEHDPIRDDGWRYAARLRAAGVPVRITEYAGAAHGFLNFPGLNRKIAARAMAEIAAGHGVTPALDDQR